MARDGRSLGGSTPCWSGVSSKSKQTSKHLAYVVPLRLLRSKLELLSVWIVKRYRIQTLNPDRSKSRLGSNVPLGPGIAFKRDRGSLPTMNHAHMPLLPDDLELVILFLSPPP